MIAHTKSIVDVGFIGVEVGIECHLSNSLPNITIVGLAGKSVDEAKERLRVAIKSSGATLPKKRIILNLTPAELPKDTASIDLAMAIAILIADGQLSQPDEKILFIGELGLDGDIKAVRGIVGKLRSKVAEKATKIYISEENIEQAELTQRENIIPVKKLVDVINDLNGTKKLFPIIQKKLNIANGSSFIDMGEIKGQDAAKRALLIAAAGKHNILMSGPPGTGKSMLAKAFTSILPALDMSEALEVTHIHSLSSRNYEKIVTTPPLRSPHHTASDISIIGGGHSLRPGEISLAHNGVLFLDELPEFRRYALESLRQPLEDGRVTIARAQQSVEFPANFILIATSNPCPCGYLDSSKECICSASEIQRYQKKLSGPIMDRIDLHVNVSQVEHKSLLEDDRQKESPQLREKVVLARKVQLERQKNTLNSNLSNSQLKKYAKLTPKATALLNSASEKLQLSARSYMRTVKLARTIADLGLSYEVNETHIAEALQYRPKKQII